MSWLSLLHLSFLIWLALTAVMAFAWLVQQRSGNSGWVDVFWTFGVALVAIATAIVWQVAETNGVRFILVISMTTLWALRLGGYIVMRTKDIADDPRYAKLSADWGARAPFNMFWLLQFQALASVPLCLAIVLAALNPAPTFAILDVFGVLLFVAGISGSAIADQQLRHFKGRPDASGQICDVGLWSLSRHPNYFFEWLVWCAYPLLAVSFAGGWPWGWLAFAAPILMYVLLNNVSGIPPLEAHMTAKYGEKYLSYQRRTSAFFPIPTSDFEEGQA